MSDESGRRTLGAIEKSLALAVDLRDAVTGEKPTGSPSVALADRRDSFTLTPGGYYVLTDLPGDAGTVTVVVNGGEAYLDERRPVDLATADRSTAETVELLPSPAYPFGGGATVVRGMVANASGDGVQNAAVSIQDRSESTRTTPAGEYALWIRAIDNEDVTSSDTLQVADGTPTVTATHPKTGATTTTSATITVGETTRLDLSV